MGLACRVSWPSLGRTRPDRPERFGSRPDRKREASLIAERDALERKGRAPKRTRRPRRIATRRKPQPAPGRRSGPSFLGYPNRTTPDAAPTTRTSPWSPTRPFWMRIIVSTSLPLTGDRARTRSATVSQSRVCKSFAAAFLMSLTCAFAALSGFLGDGAQNHQEPVYLRFCSGTDRKPRWFFLCKEPHPSRGPQKRASDLGFCALLRG